MRVADFERRVPKGVEIDEFQLKDGHVQVCKAHIGDRAVLYDGAGRAYGTALKRMKGFDLGDEGRCDTATDGTERMERTERTREDLRGLESGRCDAATDGTVKEFGSAYLEAMRRKEEESCVNPLIHFV